MRNIQLNMTRGEISPLLDGHIDLDHYKAGMALARNWVPMRFGGLTRMPGTVFYGETKFPNSPSRFLPFKFNRTQTYAIEAGHLYFRFWNFLGRIENPPGTPVEIATPYAAADLPYLQVRQSGDIIYIACDGYAPRELRRFSELLWQLTVHETDDGPYLPQNTTSVTLTPAALSGTMIVTISSPVPINGGIGFINGDVGRVFRFMADDGIWRWFRITNWTNATTITAQMFGQALPNVNPRAQWRMGAWSPTTGYPAAVGIYDDRLGWAGTAFEPTKAWFSVPGDYDNHKVSSPLVEDDAMTVRMTGGELNATQWMGDAADVLIGTEGTLRAFGPAGDGAFSPLNQRARKDASTPTSYIPPLLIEDMILLLDLYRTRMYEVGYSQEGGGYMPRELSAVNEHLFSKGVVDYAYQSSPHKIIWCVTEDGTLLAVTYDRDQQVFGVTECLLGDELTQVKAVLSLPGVDKDGDQLWLIVNRFIDGTHVTYVELLSSFYRAGYTEQEYPIYAHCAGVYEGVSTNVVTGIDHLAGQTVGVWSNGLDVGDFVVSGAGVLTIPPAHASTRIVFGLRYESDARTLRLNLETREGGTFGNRQSITNGIVDVYQSAGLRIGTLAGVDLVRPESASEDDPYGVTPLRSGTYPFICDDSWENNGVVVAKNNSMYPSTIRAFIMNPEAESES